MLTVTYLTKIRRKTMRLKIRDKEKSTNMDEIQVVSFGENLFDAPESNNVAKSKDHHNNPKIEEKSKVSSSKKSKEKLSAVGENMRLSFSEIDFDNLERSCDGVRILPFKIGCFESYTVKMEEFTKLSKVGTVCFTEYGAGVCVKFENAIVGFSAEIDEDFPVFWCMSRIDLVKKVKARDGLVYVDIKVYDEQNPDGKIIRVPFSWFNENRIGQLSKYNVDVASKQSALVSTYFKKLLEKMPMEIAEHVVGVIVDPMTDKVVFNGYGAEGIFKVKNQYQDYKDYLKHFNPLLEQSESLQYLLSATMAAPILTLLQKKYGYDLHSYCINIVGSSSTGKTICSRVCASAWTDPCDEAIFSAMLSTGNAALKSLSGRYGAPVFLDEATSTGNTNSVEYAYAVYEGREKKRLNPDCSVKASGTWSTIICMSSEQHFHDTSKNQNGGLVVRVHSMENLTWTTSKEHADRLNKFISKSYGVLGKKFTELLFSDKLMSSLEQRYDSARNAMMEICQQYHGDFTDRLCQSYALTYMTAKILKSMGLSINVKAVADLMAKHNEMVFCEQNLAFKAYCAIVSYVALHDYGNPGLIFTKKKKTDKYAQKVAVEETLMAQILDKAGFKDLKVTMKELAKAGYLIRQEKDGLKSRLVFNKVRCFCYQIDLTQITQVPGVDEDAFEMDSNDRSKLSDEAKDLLDMMEEEDYIFEDDDLEEEDSEEDLEEEDSEEDLEDEDSEEDLEEEDSDEDLEDEDSDEDLEEEDSEENFEDEDSEEDFDDDESENEFGEYVEDSCIDWDSVEVFPKRSLFEEGLDYDDENDCDDDDEDYDE
jgi:hypothetical protein